MEWSSFSGEVAKCGDEVNWFIVMVPPSAVPPKELSNGKFGYIPITAKIAESEWDSSLMPAGDGRYFFAIPKKIRAKQGIDEGSKVTVEFCLRDRNVKRPLKV